MTCDPERAKKFYAETIGWTYQARPMPHGGTAVVNADDAHAQVWIDAAGAAGAQVATFGFAADASVGGKGDVSEKAVGFHNLSATPPA